MSFEQVFYKFPYLETQRLILRELSKEDISDIFEFFSDEQVTHYLDFYSLSDIKMVDNFVKRMNQGFKKKEIIRWGIIIKETGKVIGTCFISDFERNAIATIGYDLSRDYWRKGIMNEVLITVLNFAFEEMNLNRIQAIVHPDNIASKSLLQKRGFTLEGLLRDYEYHYDKESFNDVYMFSLLRREHNIDLIQSDKPANICFKGENGFIGPVQGHRKHENLI